MDCKTRDPNTWGKWKKMAMKDNMGESRSAH